MAKVKNRFEQVDEIQSDAITLSLGKDGDKEYGVVVFPASASAGRLVQDSISGQLAAQDSFRSAIKLANEMKVAVVVIDPQGVWKPEWGDLYRKGLRAVHSSKLFLIDLATRDAKAARREAEEMCRRLLANPVIHDYSIRVEK